MSIQLYGRTKKNLAAHGFELALGIIYGMWNTLQYTDRTYIQSIFKVVHECGLGNTCYPVPFINTQDQISLQFKSFPEFQRIICCYALFQLHKAATPPGAAGLG